MKPIIISIMIMTNLFRLELAVTEQEKVKGMMYRKSWGEIDGMLFINKTPHQVVYWMKNTYLNMAMLFIDQNYNLTEIQNPKILSEDLIVSQSNNISFVLELKPELTNIILKNYSLFKTNLSNKLHYYITPQKGK